MSFGSTPPHTYITPAFVGNTVSNRLFQPPGSAEYLCKTLGRNDKRGGIKEYETRSVANNFEPNLFVRRSCCWNVSRKMVGIVRTKRMTQLFSRVIYFHYCKPRRGFCMFMENFSFCGFYVLLIPGGTSGCIEVNHGFKDPADCYTEQWIWQKLLMCIRNTYSARPCW